MLPATSYKVNSYLLILLTKAGKSNNKLTTKGEVCLTTKKLNNFGTPGCIGESWRSTSSQNCLSRFFRNWYPGSGCRGLSASSSHLWQRPNIRNSKKESMTANKIWSFNFLTYLKCKNQISQRSSLPRYSWHPIWQHNLDAISSVPNFRYISLYFRAMIGIS
jgi:hypothetical protein